MSKLGKQPAVDSDDDVDDLDGEICTSIHGRVTIQFHLRRPGCLQTKF